MNGSIEFPLFLGVCERALVRGDGFMQELYGVGDVLPFAYFPQGLQGIHLLIAFHRDCINQAMKITLRNMKRPELTAWYKLETVVLPGPQQVTVTGLKHPYSNVRESPDKPAKESIPIAPLLTRPDFLYKLMCIPCPLLMVMEPTDVDVMISIGEIEKKIGTFRCEFVETPAISEEERAAIMSRPGALRGFKLILGCKTCREQQVFFLLLDPNGPVPEEFRNDRPLNNAPDEWVCKCGQNKASLVYAKKGLHEIFRTTSLKGERYNLEYKPLYQRGALAAIIQEYQRIIREHADSEEIVQKFLEEKQVLWNFLAPIRIWKKPLILSKYKADFAILNRNRILYFVEIEKPATKIAKRGGGLHSELQAGFDQIRDWRKEVLDRREAVLDGLGLKQGEVHAIKFIVVAGMAAKTPPRDLEKLRSMTSDADIFCFDELASFLHSTETALLNI